MPTWTACVQEERAFRDAAKKLNQSDRELLQKLINEVESETEKEGARWKALAKKVKEYGSNFPTLNSVCKDLLRGETPASEKVGLQWIFMDSAICLYCGKNYTITKGDFKMELVRKVSTSETNGAPRSR